VSLGRADLFFDQVEVIEQPFLGWCDPLVCRNRRREQIADFNQNMFVVSQPRQKPVRRTPQRVLPCWSI
jgi:hypothetical protein